MGFEAFVDEIERLRPAGCENLVLLTRAASTNSLARRIAEECLEECSHLSRSLIVAYEQSAGRGRRGNRWASPAGRGVYATLLEPLADREALESLPLLTAVGLCRGLDRHLGEDSACRLKWPNDLLVGGRKIAGILIEAFSPPGGDGAVALIGFGVNHGQEAGELPTPEATSLRLADGRLPGLGELLWDLFGSLEAELAHAGDSAYATRQYEARTLHRPGERLRCRTADEVLEGTFRGFDERGFLRLETAAGERLLAAGEVLSR